MVKDIPSGYFGDSHIVVNGNRVISCRDAETARYEQASERSNNQSGSIGSYPGVEPEIRRNPSYIPPSNDGNNS